MKIKLLDAHCKPSRSYPTDSGLDLRARLHDSIWLQPMNSVLIPTGIAIELEQGCEAQVRPRSGLSKKGILVASGTVDNSYRGEICAVLTNISMYRFEIKPYDRIAQLVVAPVHIPKIEYVDKLNETDRGDDGFGSTGTI